MLARDITAMNEYNCHVPCYDVRQLLKAQDLNWTTERKQYFLYRLDVDYPLSTDRYVLDTFDSRYYDADAMPYTGPFSPFWGILAELQLFTESLNLNAKDYMFMAISLDISLLAQGELKYWNKLLGNKGQVLLKSKLFEIW